MRLSERIDRALQQRHLAVSASMSNIVEEPEPVQRELVQREQARSVNQYQTLNGAIEQAAGIQPDEDGLRICIVETIDMKSITLPLKVGKYIIEDIQPFSSGGYEVHLAETSNQR